MRFPRLDTSGWQRPTPSIFACAAAAILIVQALTLIAMGHPVICTCGHVDLWSASASGPETSQQLTDWYSFTHVGHGLLFYLLLWLVAPDAPFAVLLLLALGIEASWEIVENTPAIIDRYRQTALAAGYFGDSVVNSIGDTLSMAFGFVVARTVPVWLSVLILLGLEALLAIMIHDDLTLNIIQLVHPFQAIANWQAG